MQKKGHSCFLEKLVTTIIKSNLFDNIEQPVMEGINNWLPGDPVYVIGSSRIAEEHVD